MSLLFLILIGGGVCVLFGWVASNALIEEERKKAHQSET